MKQQSKPKEWLDRYLLPTILSLVLSIGLALALKVVFNNPVITALGGTWGDNIGFYGLIIYKDIKERRAKEGKVTLKGIVKQVRNMIAEFGPGEYLDSFLIRPALMYAFPKIVGNDAAGIFIAKFTADITFFLPTIVFYELRKKVFKD